MKLLSAALVLFLAGMLGGCATPPAAPVDPYEYLTLSGEIDGSDKFIFTPAGVSWKHLHWSEPTNMVFAGSEWNDLRQTPVSWSKFASLDLAHAAIIKRKGRDVVALEHTQDGFVLYLDDAPNGAGIYSVTIAIPKRAGKH